MSVCVVWYSVYINYMIFCMIFLYDNISYTHDMIVYVYMCVCVCAASMLISANNYMSLYYIHIEK